VEIHASAARFQPLAWQVIFMKFDITALSQEETTEARALFSSVFNHSIPAGQWNWKYAQGPRLGSINLVARTPAGELIGHIGCLLFPGVCKGRPLVFAQVCDVMVSRSGRGGLESSGVYPQLAKAMQQALRARAGEVFAYGFPGVRPFRLGERMGFYRCRYAVHSSRFEAGNANGPGLQANSLVPAEWNPGRLDAIWSRHAGRQNTPALARTGAYLQWRYAAHPERSYKLWIFRRFWKDMGWLVTSSMPNHDEVMVDSLLPPHISVEAACQLLRQSLKAMQHPVAAIIHWLGPCGPSTQANGIIAIEFRVNEWQTQYPCPVFQPGDTDVF
jgi:hypothetical protein